MQNDKKLTEWSCPNCREVIEEQFDSCWNCGCSREGKLNLEFVRPAPNPTDNDSLERKFAEDYICHKCNHHDAIVQRMAFAGGAGLASLIRHDFLSVSCANCGYTEFFSLDVLEGRSMLQNWLRGLFNLFP